MGMMMHKLWSVFRIQPKADAVKRLLSFQAVLTLASPSSLQRYMEQQGG